MSKNTLSNFTIDNNYFDKTINSTPPVLLNTDTRDLISLQANTLPTAKPTCTNIVDMDEEANHSDQMVFCGKCGAFFCTNCADMCVFSAIGKDIPFPKKKAAQQIHSASQIDNKNSSSDLFTETNCLVNLIKEWGRGDASSKVVCESYLKYLDSVDQNGGLISPYFQRELVEPLKHMCEKIIILKKAEDNIIRFSEMFTSYNKQAQEILNSFHNDIAPLLKKFCDTKSKYLKLADNEQYLHLKETQEKLHWNDIDYTNPIECCIVGIPNSGKTTFLNAILGKNLLPTKEGRCTIANTQLRYADIRNRRIDILDDETGQFIHLPQFTSEQLMKYDTVPPEILSTIGEKTVCEKETDNQTQKTVCLYWDAMLLKTGIVFSDTPGYDDISEEDVLEKKTAQCKKAKAYLINPKTLEFINRSNVILLVVDMGHTYTSKDPVLNFLAADEMKGKKLIVVLNKGNMFGRIGELEDRGWESFISYCKQHQKHPIRKFFKQLKEKPEHLHTPFEASLSNHWNMMATKGVMADDIFPVASINALHAKVKGYEVDAAFSYLEDSLFRSVEGITKQRILEFSNLASISVNNLLRSSLLCKNWHLHMVNMQNQKRQQLEDIELYKKNFENEISELISKMRNELHQVLAKADVKSKHKLKEVVTLIHVKVMTEYWNQLQYQEENEELSNLAFFGILAIPLFLVIGVIALPFFIPYKIISTIKRKISKEKYPQDEAKDTQPENDDLLTAEDQADENEELEDESDGNLSLLKIFLENKDFSAVIDLLINMYPKTISDRYHISLRQQIERTYNEKLKSFDFALSKNGKDAEFFKAWREFAKCENVDIFYDYYSKNQTIIFETCNEFQSNFFTEFRTKAKDMVGNGAFGKVFKWGDKAIKYIATDVSGGYIVDKELFFNSQLSHEHIVKTYYVAKHISEFLYEGYIVQEFLPQSLKGWMETNNNTKKAIRFALEIAFGLRYLQSCNIMHRDVALQNIMIDSKENIKIIDFGVAKEFIENVNTANQGHRSTMAPEMKKSGSDTASYDFKCDIYSYGKILGVLLPDTDDMLRVKRQCLEEKSEFRIGSWTDVIAQLYPCYQTCIDGVDIEENAINLARKIANLKKEEETNKSELLKELKEKKIIQTSCLVQ